MEVSDLVYAQDEGTLKPWIDAHQLKRIEGTWYKDGRRVVMGVTLPRNVSLDVG